VSQDNIVGIVQTKLYLGSGLQATTMTISLVGEDIALLGILKKVGSSEA